MEIEDLDDMNEEEAVVDMEGELISALEEIDRLRLKKRKQKVLLMKYEKDGHGPNDATISLKIELEEAKKIEDTLRQQLSSKIKECERLEAEIVSIRKDLEKSQAVYHQNMTYAKATNNLNNILDSQRSPLLKTGIGYDESMSKRKSETTESVKFVKANSNSGESKCETSKLNNLVEHHIQQSKKSEEKSKVAINNEGHGPHSIFVQGKIDQRFRRPFSQRQSISRYQNFFYGYCFCCSEFGHKAMDCQFNLKNLYKRFQNSHQKVSHPPEERRINNNSNNPYNHLYDEPECYICHNFGHKASDCRLKFYDLEQQNSQSTENDKVWKKKESNKCGLVLSAQKQKDSWYIDSGCSRHMTGDRHKFLSLTESKSGNVTFGNNAPGRIKGKGLVTLDNGRGKEKDVLFVDGLKHNLLSVSQMCDRGCKVTFTTRDCKIESTSTGKVVAKGIRTDNNVYVLKEESEECNLSKVDESWLWHKRLGHLSFDHLMKLNKYNVVRNFPNIEKPHSPICKPCQMGKLTRTSFKTKSQPSTNKPLQLVHMDLCGPSRQKGTGGEWYFMLVIDDFSRLTWVAFLKEKSEAFEKFKVFKALTENQTGRKIKSI